MMATKTAADWGLPFYPINQISGIGYNIIYAAEFDIFIAIGTWTPSGGFITVNTDGTGTFYIEPYKKLNVYADRAIYII